MKASEYREQVEAQLRSSSVAPAAVGLAESPEYAWREALGKLSNPSTSVGERKSALQILQAGTFLGREFDVVRAEYTEALRKAATDADESVRHFALDVLVGSKDDFARQQLADGLQGKIKPLLQPAAALALLARDDHSSATAVARSLLGSSNDTAVRAQAVRVLGSDPTATDLLAGIMKNKDEFREVRRAGAVALKGLSPDLFRDGAIDILRDSADFPDIKSTVGGALERSGMSLDQIQSGPSLDGKK